MSHRCQNRMRKIRIVKDKTNIEERLKLPIERIKINVEDEIKILKHDLRSFKPGINFYSWNVKKEIRKMRDRLEVLNMERVHIIGEIIRKDPNIEMCIDCSGLGIVCWYNYELNAMKPEFCDSCDGLGYFTWIDEITKRKTYVYTYDGMKMLYGVVISSKQDPRWNKLGYTNATKNEFGPSIIKDMIKINTNDYGIDSFPEDLTWRYIAYYYP